MDTILDSPGFSDRARKRKKLRRFSSDTLRWEGTSSTRRISIVCVFCRAHNWTEYGDSEKFVAEQIKKNRLNRDDLVIATKYSLPMLPGSNYSGNHKKNMRLALEASLERLDTTYVDLFYVHCL